MVSMSDKRYVMKEAAATDAKNKFGQILEMAMTEPVTIEKKGRPVAVILSFAEYQRLTEMDDHYWGEKALIALEGGFETEEDTKTWLKEKLDAKTAHK
jgi:prevent-host-death family protein